MFIFISYPGESKDTINGIIYLFVVTTALSMQFYAEWKKFRIKSTSASNSSSDAVSGVFKTTGQLKNKR
jgi:hypothetical protein